MDAQSVLCQDEAAPPIVLRRSRVATEAAIAMKVEINAAAQRIFAALTEPEFLEAWLSLPGTRTGMHSTVSRIGNDLHINLPHEELRIEEIVWKSLVHRRRKIVFNWVNNGTDDTRTIVHIRLKGNFGSTIVDLYQYGFGSSEQCDSHRAAWRVSLAKLQSIMRAPNDCFAGFATVRRHAPGWSISGTGWRDEGAEKRSAANLWLAD